MNREQKAVTIIVVILVLVIVGFSGGTYYMWKSTQIPILSPPLQRASQTSTNPVAVGTTPGRLYYFEPGRESLTRQPVNLPLEQRAENLSRLIRLAWDELRQPPALPSLVSPIPPDSEIEAVFVDLSQRTVYLSLNEAYYRNHPGGTVEGWASLYAIVNTVCSISSNIEKVVLLRQGRPAREGPGGWDYSRPYRPDETLVRVPQS